MGIFNNADFYPTPPEVIETMISGMDLHGKTVLEPSAGKGDLVKALKYLGAEVVTYEKEPDLQKILAGESTFMGEDFLQAEKEDLSHIHAIIANPPFSTGGSHILKMWEVAPEGCEIVTLCNTQTLRNNYTRERRQLEVLVRDYGQAFDLGEIFTTAERRTSVEVSLIRLFKPVVNDEKAWDGFFTEEDEEELTGPGIMPYNEIRSIVNRYVGAVKCFEQYEKASEEMNQMLSPLGLNDGFSCSVSYGKSVKTKAEFSKELQKESWKWIFKQMNVGKFVTSGVMQDINKFVEQQQQYPFTMKNIYRMFEIIVGTRSQTMDRAMIEVFDKLTKHHHENRYQVEGWKTNSHYLVNKKFILEWVTELGWSGEMGIAYNGNQDKMNDLHKALCYLTGQEPWDTSRVDENGNYTEKITTLKAWVSGKKLEFGQWYDWGFFEVKGFKKRTLHCKFKDENVWALFNRKVAEIKGFPLPEKF